MIITRTPFRLSFFGGGTDYNVWFEENEGLVISSAFTKYCYISLRKLPPFFEHHSRACYSINETVQNNQEFKHRGIASCLKYLNMNDPLEIHHDGDLPARSGIGSSSSFTVGFLHALHAYNKEMISKRRLADEAIEVEQNVACENVGIQDQILASYGGLQVLKMGPGNSYDVSPLVLPSDYLESFQDHVLLAFSGVTRIASSYAGSQIRLIGKGKLDEQMREIHSIAKEALVCFMNNSDFSVLGKLLHRSWQIKRLLTDKITTEKLDLIYDIAYKAGAYGGKVLGAGGGGFLMFLAPPEKHMKIKEALSELKVWVPFNIDFSGSKIITYNDDMWGKE